jgi:hypothetical protein
MSLQANDWSRYSPPRTVGKSTSKTGKRAFEGNFVWWQYVLFVSIVALLITIAFFAVGVARFYDSVTKRPIEAIPNLLEDITFLLLLSNVVPSILNNFLELEKLRHDTTLHWKGRLFLRILLLAAIGLAIAAPVLYYNTSPEDPWRSVKPTILSFATNLISILANVLGVFIAAFVQQQKLRDEEDQAQSQEEADRNRAQSQQSDQRQIEDLSSDLQQKTEEASHLKLTLNKYEKYVRQNEEDWASMRTRTRPSRRRASESQLRPLAVHLK